MIRTLLKLVLGRGTFRSYSQFGEDAVVRKILPKIGTYVDVGCYHPHLYSNTYALYRIGWSGICIDPNPKMARLFKFFRPRDTFIHAAVGKQGTASYQEHADGAYNQLIEGIDIVTKPLQEFLSGINHVDLLSIDAEGRDAEILQTYDWRLKPTVIIAETDYSLADKGYRLIAQCGPSYIWQLA